MIPKATNYVESLMLADYYLDMGNYLVSEQVILRLREINGPRRFALRPSRCRTSRRKHEISRSSSSSGARWFSISNSRDNHERQHPHAGYIRVSRSASRRVSVRFSTSRSSIVSIEVL